MKRLLLILLLLGSVFAADDNPPPTIDLGPLINALTNLPGQIVSEFFTYLVNGLASTAASLTDAAFKFIFASPDPHWLCSAYNAVMAVLNSLYALVLMGLALFFIVRSGDVEGRLEARKWLENLLVMIVVLSFSFPLFCMLLDFNTYLVNSLANQSMNALFHFQANPANQIMALVVLLFGITFQMATYITLLLRYILIFVMLLLFPISIFLYFIPPMQNWGKTFIKIILVFIFMPTADALVLVGISSLFGSNDPNLVDTLVRSSALLFGFASIGIVNLVLIVMAILSVVMQSRAISLVAGFALLKKIGKK